MTIPKPILDWLLVANPALLFVLLVKIIEGNTTLRDLVRRVERLETLYIR